MLKLIQRKERFLDSPDRKKEIKKTTKDDERLIEKMKERTKKRKRSIRCCSYVHLFTSLFEKKKGGNKGRGIVAVAVNLVCFFSFLNERTLIPSHPTTTRVLYDPSSLVPNFSSFLVAFSFFCTLLT